jgi:transcriptional regulator with XRE-family HTH domain
MANRITTKEPLFKYCRAARVNYLVRKGKRLTQPMLAMKTGLSIRTISDIESGKKLDIVNDDKKKKLIKFIKAFK